MIKVEAVWLAVEPLDMRSGTEAAVARVVHVFGAARPHHAYLFANRRANRMKVLVHDGIGIWLAARRLHQGKFLWPDLDQSGAAVREGRICSRLRSVADAGRTYGDRHAAAIDASDDARPHRKPRHHTVRETLS
ncbi:IS66 family insertion sequence element accessory protein TnpB [Variovorax boronicumulans]